MINLAKSLYATAADTITQKIPVGARRSSDWPSLQQEHLSEFPACACCGGVKKLRVHHIKPFHLFPDLELEPTNLITLCEAKRYGLNCHLAIGHFGNWRRYNPDVIKFAIRWFDHLHDMAYLGGEK